MPNVLYKCLINQGSFSAKFDYEKVVHYSEAVAAGSAVILLSHVLL